jgi:hypothetical protein
MAFQNITGLQLGQAAMTASYATIYTTPSTPVTRTYVKDITICNTTAGTLSVYVSLVPSGGSAGASNALFYGNSLAANTTVQWTGSQIMNAGDTIQVKASNTGCTVTVTGGEAT